MNSAFNDKQAGKGGRTAVRRTLRAVLACALVLGAGGAALAQDHGDRDYAGPPQERHGERFRLPPMDRDPRQAEMQMRAYEEQRRAQQYQQAYGQGAPQPQYPQQYQEQPRPRSGRMTADERAEMRRQINEAKDFYPQRR